MKTEKTIRKLIIICFIILFILAVVLLIFVQKEKNKIEENTNSIQMQDIVNSVYDNNASYSSIKELVEAYGCVFINEIKEPIETIYLSFGKNLYEPDGTSNQQYFENLIHQSAKSLYTTRFYLYDD